jgi:glucose/arabinose dehydrogenase
MRHLKFFLTRAFTLPLAFAATLVTLTATEIIAQTIPSNVTFRNYFGTMMFNRPLLFAQYPGEDSTHIVLQQSGRIITVRRVGGAWAKTDSASITVNAGTSGGNEQGLLGFAFHPQFTANGKYFVYYIAGSGNGVSVIAQRTAGTTRRPQTDDPQTTILRMSQPYTNHNGGSIGFGTDGKLYVAFGDGGSGGDPGDRAQNLDTLFGKILRLDVDGADAYPSDSTRNYAIPADNPFVGQANRRGEIWAYGLRNPYRWNFHPTSGELWVGDVGQDAAEEIARATKGANMGWKIREGNLCYSPSSGCTSVGLTPAAISIAQPIAQSITGGAFFTGNTTSAFHNVYIFGDYVTDSVWAARVNGDQTATRIHLGFINNIVSFDRDAMGRVFVTSLSSSASVSANNGIVYVLESPDMTPAPVNLRPRTGRSDVKPLNLSELRRTPEAYEWRGLDGRVFEGVSSDFSGTAWVRPKGSDQLAQLVTMVW